VTKYRVKDDTIRCKSLTWTEKLSVVSLILLQLTSTRKIT